ncbi:hypothetical protein ACHAWU_003300 [Discostella pseudostelligera]|uniref:Sec-independent protein translocase protein TatB n=1 Tax=Discostella pseudostelligera TaxID=259834 RepID=A0ABD3MTC5_9STRA
MFDISWGEMALLSSVGLLLIGRKDLPPACRALGQQVGRIVGLIQGARLRADRYASDHQLKQLQNEFRSGLRELDAVKAELAGSMMPRATSATGGAGGNSNYYLGAMVSGVDRQHTRTTTTTTTSNRMGSVPGAATTAAATSIPSFLPSSTTSSIMGAEYLAAAQQAEQLHGNGNNSTLSLATFTSLAPRSQSVAAVAEEEWEKRGIGFRSIAEIGAGGSRNSSSTAVESRMDGSFGGGGVGGSGGAVILSNYLRQSLIYDQYERTIREQDEALRSRVEKVRNERSTITTYPTTTTMTDDNKQ